MGFFDGFDAKTILGAVTSIATKGRAVDTPGSPAYVQAIPKRMDTMTIVMIGGGVLLTGIVLFVFLKK